MKPISLAMIALFVFAPFLMLAKIQTDFLQKTLMLRQHYDTAIDNAVSDAAFVLAGSVRMQTSDTEAHRFEADAQEALVAFFDSLSNGLGAAGDVMSESRVRSHVPVVLAVGYQGLILYTNSQYKDAQGVVVSGPVVFPEKPYIWVPEDGRKPVLFTMGSDVILYNDGQVSPSSYLKAAALYPEFSDREQFDTMRLSAIAKTVRDALSQGLSLAAMTPDVLHSSADGLEAFRQGRVQNLYRTESGSAFLQLPTADDAAFRRAVSDVGLLAFVQGLPVGGNKDYSTFAFGGGRVVKRNGVVGYAWDSRLLYCVEDCVEFQKVSADPAFDLNTMVFFAGPEEAALEGYEPCPDCH